MYNVHMTHAEAPDVSNEQTVDKSIDGNPFLAYLPQATETTSENSVSVGVLNPETIAYDQETHEQLKNKASQSLYGYVVSGLNLETKSIEFLKKCAADTAFNKETPDEARQSAHLSRLAIVRQRIIERPGYSAEDRTAERQGLIESFVSGEITQEQLEEELENTTLTPFDPNLYRQELSDIAEKASCRRLGQFMILERGDSSNGPRAICLGCRVFSQCGVVTLASQTEIGVRVALTERETARLKRAVGTKMLSTMLNDGDAAIYRDATKDMFAEYQELLTYDDIIASNHKRGASAALKAKNKLVHYQLQVALTALVGMYASREKSDS